MGGLFSEGKEANFYRPDPASTKICVERWPVQVVFARNSSSWIRLSSAT